MPADLSLAIYQRVDQTLKELSFLNALMETLVDRVTDSSHVTIGEAAKILGVSRGTIRRRFAAHFQQIPGKRGEYIARETLKDAYVSAATLASVAAHEPQRRRA